MSELRNVILWLQWKMKTDGMYPFRTARQYFVVILFGYSVRGERQQEGVRSDDEVRTIDESRHGDEYGQESIAR